MELYPHIFETIENMEQICQDYHDKDGAKPQQSAFLPIFVKSHKRFSRHRNSINALEDKRLKSSKCIKFH